MNQYKHLTQEQRYPIYQCLKQGMTQPFIANNIGVNNPENLLVTRTSEVIVTSKRKCLLVKDNLCQSIKNGMAIFNRLLTASLRLQWSPEQISGHLKIHKNINISHERIY